MSITQKMYAVLENIEQQTNLLRSSGVPDNSPIATIYVPSIRENIRIARLELAEKPANLLTHLCSLTVAERETILRVAEIAGQMMMHGRKGATMSDVESTLRWSEEMLRKPAP